jgi:RNA polymerase sigma factor (sigma-70 family)
MSLLERRARTRVDRDAPGPSVAALFDEHASMVLGICRYLLRDPQAAEDAAQETFLSAHKSMLRGTRPRDPEAWLAAIARNECRRTWRVTPTAPLDESKVGTVLDPAEIVAERADLTEVASAIADLPDRQREALALREFCGLSYEQVASAMNVSEPAVDSLLSRARRTLSERLGEIPAAGRGAFVVPASFREELARLIPELDAATAGVAAGTGGATILAGVASAPLGAKFAAAGTAVVAIALPVQATTRGDHVPAGQGVQAVQAADANRAGSRNPLDDLPSVARERALPAAPSTDTAPERTNEGSAKSGSESHDYGSRSGNSGSGSHDYGSGSENSGSGSHDYGSSGSGSSGSGSSGSGNSGSGSYDYGSSGSGSSGSVGSGSSGSGSGESGGSSGSGSGESGSSGSGSSGPGSGEYDSSGSGSDSSGSGSSGSGGGSSGED